MVDGNTAAIEGHLAAQEAMTERAEHVFNRVHAAISSEDQTPDVVNLLKAWERVGYSAGMRISLAIDGIE